MNAPKTLSEAKEHLESAQTRIAELESLVQGHDQVLAGFGIEPVTDAQGVTTYTSPRLTAATNEVARLQELVKVFESQESGTKAQLAARDETIAASAKEIAELKAAAKSVEARARELLSLQGGQPLAVDASDGAELTTGVLRTQLVTEKDPNAQYEIYKKIKAQEAKEKFNARRQ